MGLFSLWYSLSHLRLYEPIRNTSDAEFSELVGKLPQGIRRINEADIILHVIADVDNIDDAITFLYPPESLANPECCIQKSFLSPLGCRVDLLNGSTLNHLPNEQGLPHLYLSLFTTITAVSYLLLIRFD